MLLRAAIALGGLTFVATGVGVFFADACRSVTWGSRGAERAGTFTATCHDIVVQGGMSQGVAGSIAVAAGLLLITVSLLPALWRSRSRKRIQAPGAAAEL